MRHNFPSNLLISGESDGKVARWLGDGDTSMVHRHYGHLLSYDESINLAMSQGCFLSLAINGRPTACARMRKILWKGSLGSGRSKYLPSLFFAQLH